MSELFGRVCELTVGTLKFSGLRVTFKVSASTASKPNTAEISIYGLSETSRAACATQGAEVRLVAGYRDTAALVFSGQVTHGESSRQPGGWVTVIEARDGQPQWTRRMRLGLHKATKHRELLKAIASEMGLQVSAEQLDLVGAGATPGPVALYGFAHAEMDVLCRSLGLEWSIQRGRLQLLPLDGATTETAVVLSPETGLIGTPQRQAKEAGKRRVIEVQSCLQPALKPGRLVQLTSQTLSGLLRCRTVEVVGDTHGADWTSTCECTEA